MKIHLGCGENRIAGWKNFDSDLDVTKLPLPFEDNSVEMVFMEHLGEHISTHQLLYLLDDCRRILQPGGTMRICMPVLNKLSVEHAREMVLMHGHVSAWTPELIAFFLRAAGFPEGDIRLTDRREGVDGHFLIIGRERDDLETARLEATK